MQTIQRFLVVSMFLVSSGTLRAADKPETIIEKAIAAQGGVAKVAKLQCMRIKVEGKMDVVPGVLDMPFTLEDSWQMPGQYKTSMTVQLAGKTFSHTQVIDGDKGWMDIMGTINDMPKEGLTEMKEQKYAEDLDRFGFLKEKGFELSFLKEIKIEDKPAVGVLVKSKGHRDVKLYFNKETGLLVKRENKLVEAGKEVAQEVFFSDYQDKDGLKHYQKIVAHRDGKKMLEAKVVELEFFDKLDATVFAKPEK
jgi:hypothetical protein